MLEWKICWMLSLSVMSDSLQLHRLQPVQAPLNFSCKNTEQVVKSYSRGASQPRSWTMSLASPSIGRWICYHCATWEAYHPQILRSPTFINYMGVQHEACCKFHSEKKKQKTNEWLDIAASEKEVQHFSQPLGMLEARYTSVQCMLLC